MTMHTPRMLRASIVFRVIPGMRQTLVFSRSDSATIPRVFPDLYVMAYGMVKGAECRLDRLSRTIMNSGLVVTVHRVTMRYQDLIPLPTPMAFASTLAPTIVETASSTQESPVPMATC